MCGNLHSNTFFIMDGHTIKIFAMLSPNNEVLKKDHLIRHYVTVIHIISLDENNKQLNI